MHFPACVLSAKQWQIHDRFGTTTFKYLPPRLQKHYSNLEIFRSLHFHVAIFILEYTENSESVYHDLSLIHSSLKQTCSLPPRLRRLKQGWLRCGRCSRLRSQNVICDRLTYFPKSILVRSSV